MAEVAAGVGAAVVAEQVISTSVQAGTAGYMIAKPTLPLKVTYFMIAHADDDDTRYVAPLEIIFSRCLPMC